MRSTNSEGRYLSPGVDQSVKVVVLGPFGAGKTTLVRAVSEIRPALTEERTTKAGEAVDTLQGLSDKTTTRVALDFGRLTLTDDLVLYLLAAPANPDSAS